MSAAKKLRDKRTPYNKTWELVQDALPHLGAYLVGSRADDFDRLQIRRRGEFDYIAICKGFDDDGQPVVCFGQGTDFVEALRAVQGAVARDAWRPDTPWNGSG